MNQQQQEKRQYSLDGSLEVHSIFKTIQGEGPFSGTPAIFIRLSGCNLQCPLCDTDYTSRRSLESPKDLVSVVNQIASGQIKLIVITGGEPFRQDIYQLCKNLLSQGYFVQIETNGTLPPPYVAFHELCSLDLTRRDAVFVVCSPKTQKVNGFLRPVIAAYKYVIKHGDVSAEDGLPVHALDHKCPSQVARPHAGFIGPVYVQPADEGDQLPARKYWNRDAALNSCMKYGYIMQLQIHKILGVQ